MWSSICLFRPSWRHGRTGPPWASASTPPPSWRPPLPPLRASGLGGRWRAAPPSSRGRLIGPPCCYQPPPCCYYRWGPLCRTTPRCAWRRRRFAPRAPPRSPAERRYRVGIQDEYDPRFNSTRLRTGLEPCSPVTTGLRRSAGNFRTRGPRQGWSTGHKAGQPGGPASCGLGRFHTRLVSATPERRRQRHERDSAGARVSDKRPARRESRQIAGLRPVDALSSQVRATRWCTYESRFTDLTSGHVGSKRRIAKRRIDDWVATVGGKHGLTRIALLTPLVDATGLMLPARRSGGSRGTLRRRRAPG
eukprot:1177188-Prorocentrum_minimum.AAC.1